MCPVDPSMLRSVEGVGVGRPVEGGRACAKCGYDLRGLFVGGVCPECGTIIGRAGSKAAVRDSLTLAPMPYLRQLAAACAGLAVLGPLNGVALFVAGASRVAEMEVVLAIVGAAWAVAVWRGTRPKPHRAGVTEPPEKEMAGVRRAARLTQCAWPTAAVLKALAATMAGAGAPTAAVLPLLIVAGLLTLAGFAGFVPLSVWLADLADWAMDTGLGNRLRVVAWMIAFGGGVATVAWSGAAIAAATGGVVGPFGLVGYFATIAVLAALILFMVSLIQLFNMARWATTNASASLEHSLRVAIRKAKRFESVGPRATADAPLPTSAGAHLGPLSPCPRCGYEQEGLPPGAPCPECGREPEGGPGRGIVMRPLKRDPTLDVPIPLEEKPPPGP
ncbi:MAG TPA: hypothetical protein PLU35_00825 [Phycisphaerales bacterium]|nr:hypothetical protein [Phycisphaerales bacterium]